MDTQVLPETTNAAITSMPVHEELQEALRKATARDERAETFTGFGATTGGMAITKTYLAVVTEGVQAALNGPRPRSNTMDFKLQRMLLQIRAGKDGESGAAVVALAILQAGLHAIGLKSTHRDAVMAIGSALYDECWASKLLQTDRKVANRINKRAKEDFAGVKTRKAVVRKVAEAAGFQMAEWSRSMLSHAGQWGMNILLKHMGDVFVLRDVPGLHEEREWTIREEAFETAQKAVDEAVLKSPVYQPRKEQPADWGSFYARVAEDDRTMAQAPLLRTGHKDIIAATRYAIRNGTMAPTLRAVNLLQSVPFKINTWIMSVIQECFDRGIEVDGLPPQKPLKVPPKLPDAEWQALPLEQRRLHAKEIRSKKKANRTIKSDRMQFGIDMKVARRFSLAQHYYCPMNLDWRTRVYALTHFNFQREDCVRAMFLFHDAKPITERGIYWLKVHVANCGAFEKVDKKPMAERVKWVDDNLNLIKDYVKRPLHNTGWTKADSPFLFLAACRELVNADAQGPSYVCGMPVSFDGSCSGLQHLAAMTRAPEGRHVNLTNNPTPSDVYQLVADLAKQRIEADLGSNEPFGKPNDDQPERKTHSTLGKLAAIALAYGIDRKLVKRNVMTFAYSSKEFGMSEQHYEDTMEPLELKMLKGEISEHPFGGTEDEWRLASRYLAKRVLEAIKSVVSLPAQAMEFMQILAKALAHEGKPLRWTTPAGAPWINRYHERTTETIRLWCYDNGVNVPVRMKVATGYEAPIAKEKAAAGVAPNFVHANDASHLMLTVCAAADEGIVDIATVHDSFGCLPCDAERFNGVIRETFLKMYQEHDVLRELYESALSDLTEAGQDRLRGELEKHGFDGPPEYGSLNLEEILSAKYAFA